ncbi:EamA-like transporter family protein [Pseudoroseicyclus aestuarii]|uniref:EamA-like transporter family protein n=2 Tax=Pseudoroseicyclus aestuarii TaxID=1795041 RepID=A0A318ST56_9RHOB|nr:EamA-like transporter family protein [Pseudoroseicyclus aestuarii]
MVLSGLMFVGMNAVVKHVGTALPTAQTGFLRFAFGLIFVAPAFGALRRARITPRLWRLIAWRGAVHSVAVLLWFYAMARIPLGDVMAINYLNPIGVTVGAAFLLREALPPRRLAAVGVALLGALVVLRPGLREIEPGHFAMLGTALGLASGYLIAKSLTAEIAPAVVVALLTVTVSICLAPFAISVWVPPSGVELGWMALAAFFATGGHYAMTRAFAVAPLTVTQPVTFLNLVWAVALGAVLFGEAVDPFVLLGGGMIIAAISFITWREARAKRVVTPPVQATKG